MTSLKADKFEQFSFTHDAFDAVRFQVTVQPEDQWVGSPTMELYDTRTVDVPMDLGVMWVEIFDDEELGWRLGGSQFAASENGLQHITNDLEGTRDDRKVLAFMYDLAETLFGVKHIALRSNAAQVA